MAEGRTVLLALDKERHLRFDINALAAIEAVTGLNLASPTALARLGIRELRAFLWGGLQHEDAQLTVAQAGDLLQGYLEAHGEITSVFRAVNEALTLAGFRAAEPSTGEAPTAPPLPSAPGSTEPSASPSASSA